MKTYCINGHLKIGENLYIEPRGKKTCKACRRQQYQKWYDKSHPEKFLTEEERIKRKIIINEDDCWVWQGALNNKGYGSYKNRGAHRVVYEVYVGKIPVGLELDHLCRNTACVNPEHLEAVTHKINMGRGVRPRSEHLVKMHVSKTHCKNGHEYSTENTRIEVVGNKFRARRCKKCDSDKSRRYYERR